MTKSSSFIQKYAVLAVFFILFMIFSVGIKSFLSPENLINIIVQSSLLAVLALGLNFVMMVGEIDISFSGSVPLLASVFVLLINRGIPSMLAFVVVAMGDMIIGLFIALLVTKLRLNSFISTAAVMFLLTGVWYTITQGKNVWITQGFSRENIYGFIGPIPVIGLILLVVFIILFLISEHTRLGMAMRAVRTDPEAARSSGISVTNTKIIAFVLAGVIFAVSTILSVARLSGAMATAGTEVMLPTMTIAFVGQSVLGLGRPNMWGVIIGAFLLGMVNNAFTLLNLPFWAVPMAYGIILMISIVLSNLGQRQINQVRM